MKVLVLSVATGLLVSGGQTLATKYSTDRTLRFEMESTIKMSTTSMEAERDGEPVETRGGGGGSETTYEEVHIDRILAAADGKPTKMRRVFEKVGGTSSMTFGENTRDSELESSFQGITLELVDKEGTVEAEVVEGSKPDGEGVLDGHKLETFLDGLLPADAVEVDGTWDLTKDGILRALRLDVRKALYARPAPSGEGEGEGRGGGRRGGGRGMGGSAGMLESAEWKGTAKLVSADKEIDGVACSVIELKLEASGSRELPARQGRRGGMFGAESALENTVSYEITIEGTLAFANKDKRPVSLKLEGTIHSDTKMEFSNGEASMKSRTVQDGKVEYKIAVTAEAVKAEAK